jgi:hypothetical protein
VTSVDLPDEYCPPIVDELGAPVVASLIVIDPVVGFSSEAVLLVMAVRVPSDDREDEVLPPLLVEVFPELDEDRVVVVVVVTEETLGMGSVA